MPANFKKRAPTEITPEIAYPTTQDQTRSKKFIPPTKMKIVPN